MWKKMSVLVLATCVVGSVSIPSAHAASYPTKPVEIVLPFPAGSVVDIMARILADITPRYLGQPLVVMAKPGAGGSVATADVASSKPDGYKILLQMNPYFASTIYTQKIPFDPNHIVPLIGLEYNVFGFGVRGDSPFKTLADLINYAEKNPNKLKWGHPGVGVIGQINAELLFKKAGVKTIGVPYKGSAERLADLLGGHLDANLYDASMRDVVRSGKFRILVLWTEKRDPEFPDVPSAAELGYSDAAKCPHGSSLFVHRDTPEEIKKILLDAFQKTFATPEFLKRFEQAGLRPSFQRPDQIKKSIQDAEQVFVPALKELGVYIER